jgi:hypothetical protein
MSEQLSSHLSGDLVDTREIVRIHCSLFQVVLPNQAEMMFNVVKEKGIPCCYVLYEGTWYYKGHVTRSNVCCITRRLCSLFDISYTD